MEDFYKLRLKPNPEIMKSIFIVLLLLFSAVYSQAQSSQILPYDTAIGKVIYSKVEKVDTTLKSINVFNTIKEWFSSDISNFYITSSEKASSSNDAFWGTKKANMSTVDLQYNNDQPLKMSDPDTKKLIGRVVLKYFGTSYGCVRLIYLTFDVKVQCKDGKYKYDITNFGYTHYNHYNGTKIGFNTLTDSGDCKSTGNIEDLLKCDNCSDGLNKFYSFIDKSVNKITSTMNEYVSKNKPSSDW